MLSMLRQNKILMTVKTIFTLADAAHAAAVEKGFYKEPRSLARTVGLVTAEIGEIMEAARKGRYFDAANYDKGDPFIIQAFEDVIKDTVQDEIADSIIRLLDLIGSCGSLNPSSFQLLEADKMRSFRFDVLARPDCFNENYDDWESLHLDCLVLTATIARHNIGETRFMVHCVASIRLLLRLAEKMGVPDIDFHIQEKMKYNRTRPYMHGKKF